jgi:hypothetical protein
MIFSDWLRIIHPLLAVVVICPNFNWRRVHIALNSIAMLLFLLQGITGVRDLLEIPVGG